MASSFYSFAVTLNLLSSANQLLTSVFKIDQSLCCSKFLLSRVSTVSHAMGFRSLLANQTGFCDGLHNEFNKSSSQPTLIVVLFCDTLKYKCRQHSWSMFTFLLLTGAFQVTRSVCLSMDLFIQAHI